MPFKSLHIIEPILRSLKEEGYLNPTPIQEQAIPIVLKGNDLLGVAQTGTGKTAAFAVPIIQLLSAKAPATGAAVHERKVVIRKRQIRGLILTPTRELAIQIDESFRAYGRYAGLTSTVIFGGVKQGAQTSALHRGVDIVIATPGRLLDLIDQGFVDLRHVEIFVLDEADRMLDMGFIHDVKRILVDVPKQRQTLFFSATMPPPIVKLAHDILDHPIRIEVTPETMTVDAIEQSLFYVDKAKKPDLLLHMLADDRIKTALVFVRTKHGADQVVKALERHDIRAEAIHGNKAQNARQRALQNFKQQRTRVLVATDIAARGIDVDDLQYVINYEIPNVPETYVHRIGRTGRAGAAGTALSFCSPDERLFIRDIERMINKRIPVVPDHPYAKGERPAIRLAGQAAPVQGGRAEEARPQLQLNRTKPQHTREHPQPSRTIADHPKAHATHARPATSSAGPRPPAKGGRPKPPGSHKGKPAHAGRRQRP